TGRLRRKPGEDMFFLVVMPPSRIAGALLPFLSPSILECQRHRLVCLSCTKQLHKVINMKICARPVLRQFWLVGFLVMRPRVLGCWSDIGSRRASVDTRRRVRWGGVGCTRTRCNTGLRLRPHGG